MRGDAATHRGPFVLRASGTGAQLQCGACRGAVGTPVPRTHIPFSLSRWLPNRCKHERRGEQIALLGEHTS